MAHGQPWASEMSEAAARPSLAAALRHPNYRIFFAGQAVSLIGTWIQIVAQAWLVTRLTGSPAMLGLVAFASQGPVFFLALLGGILADRFDRRRLLMIANGLALAQAIALAVLTLTGTVEVWHVIALAFGMGLLNAVEIPTRQSFTIEMVGRGDLRAAIALNSMMFNTARIAGPAIAGLLVAGLGEGVCFAINAVSFAGVLTSLALQRLPPRPAGQPGNAWQEARAGFDYVRASPTIRRLLALMAVSAFAGAPYMSLMPLFARDVLGADSEGYGLLMSAIGAGAFLGAVGLARLSEGRLPRVPALAGIGFGAGLMIFSQIPSFALALVLLPPTAFALMMLAGATNTLLQLEVDDALRGRVMAFFTMSFLGMMPFGSLAGGAVASIIGVAPTIFAGGLVCLLAAGAALRLTQVGAPAGRGHPPPAADETMPPGP